MEITRKKPKIHKVEKSSDQVLENKEGLKSDQRSIPEAITPLTEGKRSSQGIKKSKNHGEKILAVENPEIKLWQHQKL